MSASGFAEEGPVRGPAPDDPFEVPDEDDLPVYVISVAAELAGLHPQTLRAYEREGLIEPSRTSGGTRRYSRRDVERLRFIKTLTQDRGLNLAGVAAVMELGGKLEQARQRIRDLEEMVRTLAQRLQDDVEAAHKSHRFEIVKAPGREVEPHPQGRRRRPANRGGAPR